MLSSSTVTTNLVLAGFAVATAVSSNTTHTEKDSAQLEGITQQMVASAATSAMGVDPWRGTAIDTLTKQLSSIRGEESVRTLQDSGDGLSAASGDDDNIDTGLHFTHFCKTNDVVYTGLAWTRGMRLNPYVRVYASPTLSYGDASFVRDVYIRNNIITNIAFEITNRVADKEFLFAAWKVDTDGDSLPDFEEMYVYGTSVNLVDSDGDGLTDWQEVRLGSRPDRVDTDGDGFPDAWDLEYFDILVRNDEQADMDDDHDGLTNLEEARYGTNPRDEDTDGDWLPDGWEVRYGLNPLRRYGDDGDNGDPDGDGSPNANEEFYGTDPRNPDTDGDGILDGWDQNPTVPDGDYRNQSDSWVRDWYPNEADEILRVGYANWVDENIGYDQTNGYCKLTVTFAEDPESPVCLIVGQRRLVITEAGVYPFLLDKGVGYQFGTIPELAGISYSIIDDLAPQTRSAAFANGESDEWTCTGGDLRFSLPSGSELGFLCWMPIFYASPGVSHIYYSQTFTANLLDYRYASRVAYRWVCEDENVVISSPQSQTTRIRFSTLPSWRRTSLKATAQVGGETLESVLVFTYGQYDEPQVHLNLSLPNAILVNTNEVSSLKIAPANLSFSSDVPTNGIVRMSCVSGSEKIAVWTTRSCIEPLSLPKTWRVEEFVGTTFYIEGMEASDSLDDVEFVVEFIPERGIGVEREAETTIVDVGAVSLPGSPQEGLVIQVGTSVLFHLDCCPAIAHSRLSTVWYVRRLRSDGTYEVWRQVVARSDNEAIYTPQEGGIYQLMVQARVSAGGMSAREYVLNEDEDYSVSLRRKGDMNAFGVCSEMWQRTLWQCAMQHVGSEMYDTSIILPAQYSYPSFPADDEAPRCNIFVAHRIVESGLPALKTRGLLNRYPPLANDWGDTSLAIPDWSVSYDIPEPGYVVSDPSDDGSGHVGILDYDGYGISAGGLNVNRKFECFNPGLVFRRYEEGQ